MTDTLWADISEFQVPVNNTYPYHFLALRSHDGGHNDLHFMDNVTWANQSVASGRLWGYMVYYFYRPGFDGAASFISRIGPKPNPRMVAMIDVESAGGQVAGNQSGQINREYNKLANYLGSPHRVVGYGNVGDLNGLWPQKPTGIRLIVANYSFNPSYPGKFAHQFADNHVTPPFGPCDINSADGMSPTDLQNMFSFAAPHPATPPPIAQTPGTESGPIKLHSGAGSWKADGTMSLQAFATRRNANVITLIRASAENLGPDDFGNFNDYVVAGVKLPMAKGLAFCTLNA